VILCLLVRVDCASRVKMEIRQPQTGQRV